MKKQEILKNYIYPQINNIKDTIAYIVLSLDNNNVEGLCILKNGNTNFKLSSAEFYILLDTKQIEIAEKLPKDVLNDIKRVFNKNSVKLQKL